VQFCTNSDETRESANVLKQAVIHSSVCQACTHILSLSATDRIRYAWRYANRTIWTRKSCSSMLMVPRRRLLSMQKAAQRSFISCWGCAEYYDCDTPIDYSASCFNNGLEKDNRWIALFSESLVLALHETLGSMSMCSDLLHYMLHLFSLLSAENRYRPCFSPVTFDALTTLQPQSGPKAPSMDVQTTAIDTGYDADRNIVDLTLFRLSDPCSCWSS
jgi:hypothetical protein